MKIYFERSGGLLGKPITGVVDTDSLPSDEAVSLQTLVTEAEFFDLPESLAAPAEVYDQFQYKLVVESEESRHTVETTDTAAPDSLRPLLRHLTIMARSQRRSPPSTSHHSDSIDRKSDTNFTNITN